MEEKAVWPHTPLWWCDFSPHPKSWILKPFPVPELEQMQGLAEEGSGGNSNSIGQSLTEEWSSSSKQNFMIMQLEE